MMYHFGSFSASHKLHFMLFYSVHYCDVEVRKVEVAEYGRNQNSGR